MSPEFVITFGKKVIETALLISAPLLLAGLIVGIIVSIFQAVSSIQDITITFIPKILAVAAALFFFFPWMLSILVNFTVNLISTMANLIKQL